MRILSWIRALRAAAIQFYTVARVLAFNISIALVASAAIVYPDQSIEALIAMAEDIRHTQLPVIALGVGAFFFSLMCWYWGRVLLYLLRPQSVTKGGIEGWAGRNLPRIAGLLPLLALAFAFSRARLSDFSNSPTTRWTLAGLSIGSVALAVVAYAGLFLRFRLIRKRLAVPQRKLRLQDLSKGSQIVLFCATTLGTVLFVLFSAGSTQIARHLGPISILLLAFGTWVPLGSLLLYAGRVYHFPFLSCILGAALVIGALDLNDNHMVRHQVAGTRPLPPEFSSAFADWLQNRADRDAYDEYPVFLVAAEGGGLRAAYFTAMVLSAIQDRCPAFAQHVFAISGVSGGSLGASVFAALAARGARNVPDQNCDLTLSAPGSLQRQADSVLARDFLSPLIAAGLYPDLLQQFLPTPMPEFDRARALETGFEEAWSETTGGQEFAAPFDALWTDFPRQAVPALFLNTTRVETGDRMVISNLYPLDERFGRLTTLTDVRPDMRIRLSTAVALSSRFPFITPPGSIPIGADPRGRPVEKQRYVDGGYFENSGTATLLDLVSALRVGENAKLRFRPIVIRIGFTEARQARGITNPRLARVREPLPEFLSPPRTLFNTRSARGATSVQQLRVAINTMLDRGTGADFIEFQLQEGKVPLVLGWMMSDRARLAMSRQLAPPRSCEVERGVENDCAYGRVIAALDPPDRTHR